MDIKPVKLPPVPAQDMRVAPSGQGTLENQAALKSDGYAPGTGTMKDASADMARALFGGTSDAAQELTLLSSFKTEPVMNTNTAGWKSSLLSAGASNCFIKVPSAGGDSMLVIPFQNEGGGIFGRPVQVDSDKGLTALADVKPFGSSQALRVAQSPDGKRTYMTTCSSPLVKSYDENLKAQGDLDMKSLNSDFGRALDFKCGAAANYAYVISANSDKKYVVSLEPGTNKPLWTKECGDGFVRRMHEGPDGSLYTSLDDGFGNDAKHFLQIYSKDGQDRGKLEFPGAIKDLAFLKNGTLVVNNGSSGVKAVDVSRLSPGQYTTLWEIPGKDYTRFQPTADGKSLIALDHMEGFHRCHKLAKIDVKTGNVDWEKTFLREKFIDYRLVGDDLHVLTASQDSTTITMKKLDLSGGELWKDSVKAGEIDEYDEGMSNCITAEGNFVFGGRRDGCLYFLHPAKPGETDASLRLNLGNLEEKMESLRQTAIKEAAEEGPQQPDFEENDRYIMIDGMKLEKNRSSDES